MEEERRLFYVALTRAQDKVFLLYSTNRRRLGGENITGIHSRFISEIPTKNLERVDFQSALTRRMVGGKLKKKATLKVRRTVTTFDDF